MKFLGIDYGEKKIGLAVSEGLLAQPAGVISVKAWKYRLREFCHREKIQKIIVGVSEGRTAQKTREFVGLLSHLVPVSVEVWDETGTTQDATKKMIAGGKSRYRRRKDEDTVAAAIILQSYIDSRENSACKEK